MLMYFTCYCPQVGNSSIMCLDILLTKAKRLAMHGCVRTKYYFQMPMLFYRLYIYADTRTCFVNVGVALCKLYISSY